MVGVLLVDDSMFMRRLYRIMLEKNNINVVGEASNGYEGIAQYTQCRPDIVVLDINMPGISGIKTMREILKLDPDARVVMSSAMGQEEFVRECVLSGAKAFLVKPIVERVFVDTIKQLLK